MGWQTKPRRTCWHPGLLGAALGIWQYNVGDEWKCPCGQVFIVATKDGKKCLVERGR